MAVNIRFHDIGLLDYKETWDFQEKLFNEVLENKKPETNDFTNHLIFCEHPHVYTLGKSGSEDNLLINYMQMNAQHASFYKTNRGGDITYHGPGQLVGYPIFDLHLFKIGLKEYIHWLEEAIILSLKDLDITATRYAGATGVWLDTGKPVKTRKICAIGVRSSHWVTMHGFALNINTDLSYFQHINPCGFTDKTVTSIEKEKGIKQDFNKVSELVLHHLKKIFNFEIIE